MTFKSILPLLALAIQTTLPARDADARMRKGNDALASGLWEMAALHFSERLADPALGPDDKSATAIRLAEAWVREGKAAEALELLGQSFLATHPETAFWKGQALAGSGKFSEAVEVLTPLARDPAAPFRSEAAFTIASLELALNQPQAALDILATVVRSEDPALAAKARLHQIEILLELKRTAEAREAMPPAETISPRDAPLATFLEAHLLLAEDRPADAASGFQTLVDQPRGQSIQRHHAAALGLVDALFANDTPALAVDFLLNFIQEHSESSYLEAMFRRLQDALAVPPSPVDPILERLAQWITPPELPATGPLVTGAGGAASAWPVTTPSNDLLAFSLFTRAVGLHRVATPDARAEARHLLTRLRLENSDHFLAHRALLLIARWALDEGETARAFGLLETLRETGAASLIRGPAAFLQARSASVQGDRNQAVLLFEEAARSLSGNQAQTASLNAAVLRLTDASTSTIPILQTGPPDHSRVATDLALERALAVADPAARRAALGEFVAQHPEHARISEARLSAAEAALAEPSPDFAFARSQLDAITTAPEEPAGLDASRTAFVRLLIEDLSNDAPAAIATARLILEQFPGQPVTAEAALILGRNLFQSRSYNDARLVLEKLAAADTDPARAQAAWLLAARSAALVPTSQSQQEALILFDKAIKAEGPVASLAKLEKARLMIDMSRLPEASAFLRQWFESIPETDPLHLPAGLLLGEAIYAQGSANPDSLTGALGVYDKLLVHAKEQPAVFSRLQYLRGRTLEQLPDEKNPSLKREKQAFIAFYSVLETTSPPTEWHYFELCGFRALALLEQAGRWPAAVACAKKIASFKGPRAEEAATRASQLQLKNQIWED